MLRSYLRFLAYPRPGVGERLTGKKGHRKPTIAIFDMPLDYSRYRNRRIAPDKLKGINF
jgi:hypothetical protein